LSQPREDSRIFRKPGEKNVRWCNKQCSRTDTQQEHKKYLKRVLSFPCKLFLQKYALTSSELANAREGIRFPIVANPMLILAMGI